MKLRHLICLTAVVAILFLSSPASAQDLPEFEIGLRPFGAYQGGSIDFVSITNGNLTIDAPLFSYPQRGGRLTKNIDLVYNNKGWKFVTTCNHITGECTTRVTWRGGGIMVADPERVTGVGMSCSFALGGNTVNFATAYSRLGASHVIWPTTAGYSMSIDGTGMRYDSSLDIVTHRDGTRYFGSGSPSVIDREDANGNQINIDGTDTLGRLISLNNFALSDTIGCPSGQRTVASAWLSSFPGPNNTPSQIKLCYVSVPLSTNFGFVDTQYSATASMIQSVVLYNGTDWSTSQAWTFEYNSSDPGDPVGTNYGDLTKITFPTGGSIAYNWKMITNSTQESRAVSSRTVDANDGKGPHQWTYTPVPLSGTNVVTDPDGNDTVYTITNIGNGQAGYVTQKKSYQGSQASGSLLVTETTDYTYTAMTNYNCTGIPNSPAVFQVLPIRVTTTLPGGKVSKVETDYDTNSFTFIDSFFSVSYPGSYGQVLATRRYDYGAGSPGPLLRTTSNSYLAPSNSSYAAFNLLDALSSTRVYDGTGVMKAYTTYGYDEYGTYALQPSYVTTQHDSNPANGDIRGNRTSVHRWVNTSGAYLVSSSTFNDTGTVAITTNPKLYSTFFEYSPNYVGAYVTKITDPRNHIITNTYDFNTGLIASITDPNNQTTSYSYDQLWRTTQTTFPDSGWTSFAYQDAAQPFNVTVTKIISSNPDVRISAQAIVDGVGRVAQAKLLSDPEGVNYIDTTYDNVGLREAVSNPYRSMSDPTYGVTTTEYDALGRTKMLIPSDGSPTANNVSTVYSDNCTTVTDEAGKIRRSCTDALGRLIEVDEPSIIPATPGTGFATVSGSEQSVGGSAATSGTGSVTITGLEKSKRDPTCDVSTCPKIYDSGTVSITVNGFTKTVSYDYGSTNLTIATALGNAFNGDSSSPVTASVSSNVVYLTTKATGASTNYPLSASYTYDTGDFNSGSFIPSTSGSTLTGGANATAPTYDTGSVWVTVNGFQASASYGQSSTTTSLASAIVNVFNTSPSSPVSAALSGSQVILTAKLTGPSSNYSLSGGSSTSQPASFTALSFSISVSAATLTGGSDQGSNFATPSLTLYAYDALDNLICAVQKGTDTTAFTTCAAAPITWRPRSFTYNSLSQLLTSNNPESGQNSYTYDANGNMLTKTDARGITTTYAYNEVNQLTGRTYSNLDPSVSYTYDEPNCLGLPECHNVGRRTSMTDAAGSQAWAYDKMGRVLADQRTTNGITKITLYTYNLDGSLASITYPSGRKITYAPSAAGRALSAVDQANLINYATAATYAPQGTLSSLSNGSSIVSTFYYNIRLQPCRISMKNSGVAPGSCADTTNVGNILDFSYNFNVGMADNGNVMGFASNRDTTRSQSFAYDALNRIASAQTASAYSGSPAHCWGEVFNYDPWANLLSIGTSTSAYIGCTQESLSLSVNTKNQVTNTGFAYDAAGNSTADGLNTYAWDAEGQIKTATGVNYLYDGNGNRVQKSNGKIYWYGAGTEILAETDLSGNLTNEYVYFNGRRIARRDSSGNIYYYMEDFLGSSRVITTDAGTVCYDADFYPFGGERAYTNTCPQNYKFQGKERDTETGNDDFGARYYSSSMGRWLSADWSAIPVPVPYANLTNPQTLNLYAMVHDNPETFADLDGHISGPGAERDAIVNMSDRGGLPLGGDSDMIETQSAEEARAIAENNAIAIAELMANTSARAQDQTQQILVSPDKKADFKFGGQAREQMVDYNLVQRDSKGNISPVEKPTEHKVELNEELLSGDPKKVTICTGQCVTQGTLTDMMSVTAGKGHSVEKRFLVDGKATKIYDPATKKAYDFVRVDASVKKGFVFNYGNDPN